MPATHGRPGLGPGAPVVAVDVGGTSTKSTTVAADGRPGPVRRVPSPPPSPDSPAAVLALARAALARARRSPAGPPAALGIALPGIVVEDRGLGVYSENLGWRDVDFAALFAAGLDLPVAIVHDVRAAGAAEFRLGAAAGARTTLLVVIGTGISAALVVSGRPHVAGGYAGEIGHAVAQPGGEPCVCGNRGCLEAVASAAALARRYAALTGAAVPGAREVLRRAADGDAVARAVRDSAFDALAFGLSHAICLLAPEVIVLGGGLAQAGEDLLGPVRERLADLVRLSAVPPLLRATLGADAGLIGAALAARDLTARDLTARDRTGTAAR